MVPHAKRKARASNALASMALLEPLATEILVSRIHARMVANVLDQRQATTAIALKAGQDLLVLPLLLKKKTQSWSGTMNLEIRLPLDKSQLGE